MQPASHLKKTIDFYKGFKGLLEVLKMLAVAEYHILERRLKVFQEIHEISKDFFNAVDVRLIDHPFVNPKSSSMGVVAVTSDAGLLGGMNAQVMARAVDLVKQNDGKLIIVGEKGQGYAQDMGIPFAFYPGVLDTRRAEQAHELRDYITQKVLSGSFGPVRVVYPRALSFVIQRVEVIDLLPFVATTQKDSLVQQEIIFESDPKDVVEYLVYLVMGQQIFEIFGMSRVAEQAARFLHLEESCNKIQEMNHKLLLQYFRRRHEVIDANMRELFAARSIYAK